MKYIQGNKRNQAVFFPITPGSLIPPDNEVCIIDIFVNNFNFSDFRIYKQYQSIEEQPFGIIKRYWGYVYTTMKHNINISADIDSTFLANNLRRLDKFCKDLYRSLVRNFASIIAQKAQYPYYRIPLGKFSKLSSKTDIILTF